MWTSHNHTYIPSLMSLPPFPQSINTYIWNPEKWYWWTLIAGKEWRCRCRTRTCGHIGGGSEWDEWRELHQHIYTIMCKTDSRWEVAAKYFKWIANDWAWLVWEGDTLGVSSKKKKICLLLQSFFSKPTRHLQERLQIKLLRDGWAVTGETLLISTCPIHPMQ